jgi:hypothetical protein
MTGNTIEFYRERRKKGPPAGEKKGKAIYAWSSLGQAKQLTRDSGPVASGWVISNDRCRTNRAGVKAPVRLQRSKKPAEWRKPFFVTFPVVQLVARSDFVIQTTHGTSRSVLENVLYLSSSSIKL